MTDQQLEDLKVTFGKQASDKIKEQADVAEKKIDAKFLDLEKGIMTKAEFEAYKKEALTDVNTTINKLETAMKTQGEKMAALAEKAAPNSKSIETYIKELAPKIKELKQSGKYMEISGEELKAAGVTSIAGSIQDMTAPPGSPYAPGIGGDLTIFDIVRNPNFITSHVDIGSTNQSRLAWANETDYQGTPGLVAEGGIKPLTQHKFQVEMSVAKKVAGYVEITEEFDSDLPNFATIIRRMLQTDVLRAWDDQIQVDVLAAAVGYNIANLDDSIAYANDWDGILSMMAQVYNSNFIPNTVALNPFENVRMKTAKNANGTYLLPAFADEIQRLLVQANKVADLHALVGDLMQYKVDIYKDFFLKVGWINDDFIHNQFVVLGELRYHSYISTARKAAIIYANLGLVVDRIEGTPAS